jgi:hypothetical protein
MKRLLIGAGIVLAAVVPGCVVHGHGHRHVGVRVVVPVAHVHDDFCGHYWHDGYWYHHGGHRHGPGCGHVHVGGRWCIH